MSSPLRRQLLYAALLCSLLFQGCTFTYRDSPPYEGPYRRYRVEPNVTEDYADTLDLESLPDSGAYYAYRFDAEHRWINNPDNMIADLSARGFDITTAWYHDPAPCQPPGSGYATGTVYPPVFVLHLSTPDDGLKRFWFWPVRHPKTWLCPYSITIFTCE